MKQFVESLKRLYTRQLIDKDKIEKLCSNKKITEEEKAYIFSK